MSTDTLCMDHQLHIALFVYNPRERNAESNLTRVKSEWVVLTNVETF